MLKYSWRVKVDGLFSFSWRNGTSQRCLMFTISFIMLNKNINWSNERLIEQLNVCINLRIPSWLVFHVLIYCFCLLPHRVTRRPQLLQKLWLKLSHQPSTPFLLRMVFPLSMLHPTAIQPLTTQGPQLWAIMPWRCTHPHTHRVSSRATAAVHQPWTPTTSRWVSHQSSILISFIKLMS